VEPEPVVVRPEAAADHAAVREVHERAFGRPEEAAIVERLRGGEGTLSLVAASGGRVLAHVFFGPVAIEGPRGTSRALALGPLAVLPERQRSGLGSLLVRAGLVACRERGEGVVFVLGHPEYYPRFGFRPAGPLGLHYRSAAFDRAFFVAELFPGALAGRTGLVQYPF
jgi:putative acetyltransferase